MGYNLSLMVAVAGFLMCLVALGLIFSGNLLAIPLVIIAAVLAIILIKYGE